MMLMSQIRFRNVLEQNGLAFSQWLKAVLVMTLPLGFRRLADVESRG